MFLSLNLPSVPIDFAPKFSDVIPILRISLLEALGKSQQLIMIQTSPRTETPFFAKMVQAEPTPMTWRPDVLPFRSVIHVQV